MVLKRIQQHRQRRRASQLAKTFDLVEAHVNALIADAQLLHDHGRYERAGAIAVLAIEESAKLVWVFGAEKYHVVNRRFDWVVVNWASTNHDVKLSVLAEYMRTLYAHGELQSGKKQFQPTPPRTFVKQMKNIKESGFYVPLSSGTVDRRFSTNERVSSALLALANASADLVRGYRAETKNLAVEKN